MEQSELAPTLRNTNVKKLGEQPFDVLIVGGGINGAVAAASLAGRGVRVALIDRGDFAGEWYGPDLSAYYRRIAVYVDKLLNGARPADLPVEQPSEFEFVVNLGAAKALGLRIPQSVLLRANRTIA